MKQAFLVGLALTLLSLASLPGLPAVASAQTAGNTALGTVTLGRAVMADGQRLTAGTYQVRLTNDQPKPGVGQSPDSERYVEFVRAGKVVAREVATVVPESEIKQILDSPRRPAPGSSRVEVLKGEDYVRVWLNRGGTNYIIHLPVAA
jgi:hypothetical protein